MTDDNSNGVNNTNGNGDDGGKKEQSNGGTMGHGLDHDYGPLIHVSKHPVVNHKITHLRSSTTLPGTFRAAIREITFHLGYEATSRLTTKTVPITVPIPKKGSSEEPQHVPYEGQHLAERVALIPILRSGLGMVDSMLALTPNAAVHHIGMYKVMGQNPVQYYNRLPRKCEADVAYVLDPVISTASTVMSVIGLLKKWGVPQINLVSVIGSKEGLEKIVKNHPDVYVTLGTVDDQVTDDGIVLPGLGDAGDRLFGTVTVQPEDDESLLHPSKRKRTMSQSYEEG